jgi:hypothetical protein
LFFSSFTYINLLLSAGKKLFLLLGVTAAAAAANEPLIFAISSEKRKFSHFASLSMNFLFCCIFFGSVKRVHM